MRPGIPDGGDLPLDAPVAEAARHQDPVHSAQYFRWIFVFERLRIDPTDLDPASWAIAPCRKASATLR